MNYSEDQPRMMIDKIPASAWSRLPDGTTEFLNRRHRLLLRHAIARWILLRSRHSHFPEAQPVA